MIDQTIEIDTAVYPASLRGTREKCYQWLERNPDIYIILMDMEKDIVIGYINAMPLEKKFYNEIKNGRRIDTDFPIQALQTYDHSDLYNLYLCSIAVNPLHHTRTACHTLYNAFINKLFTLANCDIFMTEILADAVTKEGREICIHTGMKSVKKTKHASELFKISLLQPTVYPSLQAKYSKLYMSYQNRYDQKKGKNV